MATWKEKGEVPDSDDDAESQDSQSTAGNEYEGAQPPDTTCTPKSIDVIPDVLEPVKGTPLELKNFKTQNRGPQSSSDIFEVQAEDIVESKNGRRSFNARAVKHLVHENATFTSSSPECTPVFQAPRLFLDLNEDGACRSQDGRSAEQLNVERPLQDEISKTYVPITSPAASLVSPPPLSLHRVKSAVAQGASQALHGSGARKEIMNGPEFTGTPIEELLADLPSEPLVSRRSLRHRNPIQLHPYGVEQEKYSRALKARGLRPTRIEESQSDAHRSPGARSRDHNSPNGLDSVQLEESQDVESDWNSMPPSSDLIIDDGNDQETNLAIDADDEFPDIDQLLRRKLSPTKAIRGKTLLKKMPVESRGLQSFSKQSASSRVSHKSNTNGEIFDLPASPPTSSSPVFTTFRRDLRSASGVVNLPSTGRSPGWLAQDDIHVFASRDLPTPMTSTTKPSPNVVLVESESDGEDPFAEELKSTQSSSPSSDKSLDVQKFSKRIRGVLPASHLRLDLQPKKFSRPNPTYRDSQSLSPERPPARRGIAIPKAFVSAQRHDTSNSSMFSFMSDESENDPDRAGESDPVSNYGRVTRPKGFMDDKSRLGFAKENDEVDAMLPSRKRKSMKFSGEPRKRLKGDVHSGRHHKLEANISDYVTKLHNSTTRHNNDIESALRSESSWRWHHTGASPKKHLQPWISILDVIEDRPPLKRRIPHFIRLAARLARSRIDKGRQCPSKKFIRLTNREDTADAHSLLTAWRSGKLQPRTSGLYPPISAPTRRSALREISGNRQTRLSSPVPKAQQRRQASRIGPLGKPRKLVVSKPIQTSMNGFVSISDPVPAMHVDYPCYKGQPELARKSRQTIKRTAPPSRPAQLESTEAGYSRQDPVTTFTRTKKALDALYRYGRKRAIPEMNLQLNRFLAADDVGRLPAEKPASTQQNNDTVYSKSLASGHLGTLSRSRKRAPHRIDADAAQYRQPSEPLILELQSLQTLATTEQGGKLTGLGKFGTKYPRHFDIFPLRPGVFFHESTFIGSGRLSAAIKLSTALAFNAVRPHASFWLGEREFEWGQWDETVSSEIGLFFDWLLEKLTANDLCATGSPSSNLTSALNSVVDYLQSHVSFRTAQDHRSFIHRISEVLLEFWKRLDLAMSVMLDDQHLKYATEVATTCAVVSMQTLRLSRREGEHVSTNSNLEDLLQKFADVVVRLLLPRGVHCIRKLYDDLQYLAIRENGIRSEQYAAQAFVVIRILLEAAKIPGVSFWEVTNPYLMALDAEPLSDARAMEKLWYSTFTLLPLCEFDEFGVVVANRRYATSFDNWAIPQRILKNVFALYNSTSRQAPGFNDYCRALLGRCHYLMVEWGWWECRSIIGTVFDFFASQDLAHLRNEEVYRSPRFLEELHSEPSLSLDAEDRCFHIFLKTLALAIKHMCYTDNRKRIPGLVTRLLPNHNRQYPKEEEIQERDLASLRNHHDLLCTIYWALPLGLRNTPDLVDHIRKLVVPERSHKAACLIDIRSWSNLARFVLTSINNDSSMAIVDSYKPFKHWQTQFFKELLEQYFGVEREAYAQADLSSARESISQTQLELVIETNRRSTLDVLGQCLIEMSHVLDTANSVTALLQAFNGELMTEVWSPLKWSCEGMDQEIRAGCLEVLHKYIDRLEAIKPVSEPAFNDPVELDSQDSMLVMSDVDRQTLIYPLVEHVLPNFEAVLRDVLECKLYRTTEPQSMPSMIRFWSYIVALMTEDTLNLQEVTNGGRYAVFGSRKQHKRAMKWWPLFLSILVEKKELADLAIAGFNLELEWILAITQPSSSEGTAYAFTEQLRKKDHYFFSDHDPFVEKYFGTSEGMRNVGVHQMGYLTQFSASAQTQLVQRLIRGAIVAMRNAIKDPTSGHSSIGNVLTKRETEAVFSNMLLEMMESMKRNLTSMIVSSESHIEYVTFCQQIIAVVRSHASDIRPLTDFFIHPSIYYWPEKSDPKLYAAGLVSYIIRLSDQSAKTSVELFYYLYNGWKSQAMNAQMGNHAAFVDDAMKHKDFVKFVVVDFLPATLSIGFSSPIGCIISADYLPALSRRIPKLFERMVPAERQATFERIVNLLKIMTNGITQAIHDVGVSLHIAGSEDRGMVSMSHTFLLSVAPALKTYAYGRPEMSALLKEVLDAFGNLSRNCSQILNGQLRTAWAAETFDVVEGQHVRRFTEIISDDMRRNWTLVDSRKIVIQGCGANHNGGFVDLDDWRQHIPPLNEVIQSTVQAPSDCFMDVLF